jgi:hypothetical protein
MRLITVVLLLTSFAVPETRYHHPIDIAQLATIGPTWTHVGTVGWVRSIRHEADGDTHLKICDGTNKWCFYAELVPYKKIDVSKIRLGDQVIVKGISRYDRQHKWWEIHPVENIEVVP